MFSVYKIYLNIKIKLRLSVVSNLQASLNGQIQYMSAEMPPTSKEGGHYECQRNAADHLGIYKRIPP